MDERQEGGHQQRSAHFVVVTNKWALLPAGVSSPSAATRGAAGRSAALVSPMKRVVAAAQRANPAPVRQTVVPSPARSRERKGAGGARLSDLSHRERTSMVLTWKTVKWVI